MITACGPRTPSLRLGSRRRRGLGVVAGLHMLLDYRKRFSMMDVLTLYPTYRDIH